MAGRLRFLMCAPDHYDVDYVINPWMQGNLHRASPELAREQWQRLHDLLASRAVVERIPPRPGVPDMVFTANAGVVVGDTVVLSRFRHPERRGEEPFFEEWFRGQGYRVRLLPRDLSFEGAGDALIDRAGGWLWAGYGFRSELACHAWLARWLDIEVLSVRLIDERFYHLDTCFCPLADGYLLYFPPAFDTYSNRLIERRIPPHKRIALEEADAVQFACNAVTVDRIVILNQASEALRHRLQEAGFEVLETPLSEFLKAGGAAKCLTLRLSEPSRPLSASQVSVESRTIHLQGHLLDSGLIHRCLDRIVDGGGSFQVLDFQLGEQRQSTSSAAIRVTAPDHAVLERLLAQLIDLGAESPPQETQDNPLATVAQDGVAPDDFYVSTIYATEVRVDGRWLRVANQRMDGAIVVTPSGEGMAAVCRLLRDLRQGDRVVVGTEGIRTLRRPELRDPRPQDFSFMGSGVSSERRVELVVEQIAWELRRIRDRGGKVVVVAGPVVIHTGGASHLGGLIEDGYVQVLLGGNAIAVHDIELALMGTSLGVDLLQGVAVEGGHRHHLRAINTIRRCGGIAAAVEQGVLREGLFFTCVRRSIPFSLAGSIRDDGPLPDTEMDLIRAQADYARLLEGADMVLMLASMLHSIGVGNMTPAGVKLVCVDINPAVVTKLSDRGSVESVGVVTDVGLFLSLLRHQLARLTGPLTPPGPPDP